MQINDLLQDTKILSFDTDFDLNQGDPSALGWEGDSTLRKKRVLKKAPEAPKRFKSAYICYVMQKMDEMKQTVDGDAKVTDIMKKLAVMWRTLPAEEKKEFEIMAEADKARYFQELSVYSGPMQVPNKRRKKNPCAPKRAMSAFLSYSQEMRPQIREEFPALKNSEVSVVLAKRWKSATEEEKRPHLERERLDRQQYYRDLAVWKAAEEERVKEEEATRKRESSRETIDFLDLPGKLNWESSGSGSREGSGSGSGSGSDGEREQRLMYLRQAFCGFFKAKQGMEMQNLARVMCAILGVSEEEQAEILESIERLVPALVATSTLESLSYNLTSFFS
mmetsp:Transcript_105687/g.207263  ORF Transcript_105687/g.207263 Transcript_105687/m.207263 type:complete len:335 (+) Transcript_105687:93-1097(+)